MRLAELAQLLGACMHSTEYLAGLLLTEAELQ